MAETETNTAPATSGTEAGATDATGKSGANGKAPADGQEGAQKQSFNPAQNQQQGQPDYRSQKYKVKAAGKEEDVPFEDLEKAYQQRRGIHQAMDELRKRTEESEKQRKELELGAKLMMDLRSKDPNVRRQIYEKLVGRETLLSDAEAFLKSHFDQEDELAKMSPREREMYQKQQQYEAQLKELEQVKQQQLERAEAIKAQRETQAYAHHIETNLTEALSILKYDAKVSRWAAAEVRPLIERMLRSNIPLNPQILAQAMRDKVEGGVRNMASQLSGEQLLEALGPEYEKKVREAIVARFEAKNRPKQRENEITIQGAPNAKAKQNAMEDTPQSRRRKTKSWSMP